MGQFPAKQILSYLSDHEEQMVEFLRRLVLCESPSSIPDSQAQILTIIFETLQNLDFDVRLIAGKKTGGHLLARSKNQGSSQSSQLLLGHCDTVWPIGTLREMPFEVDGNVIRGPGVYDMKGGVTQLVFAFNALRELQLMPEVSPIVFVNSDEEIGSIESSPYIVELAKEVDRVFVLEPAYGTGGKLKTARKGVGRFEVVVQGRAAHAGLDPEKGLSAVLELSYIIQRLFELNDLESGISVNVGTIEGGLRPNVIAPTSKAVVDVRVPSMEVAENIENQILAIKPVTPGITLEIKGSINRPPLERTPANQHLWSIAQDQSATLGLQLEDAMAGGGSDGNTTSQYVATLDGLGAVGDGAHAVHEFIYVDKMIERSALLVLLLLTSAQ